MNEALTMNGGLALNRSVSMPKTKETKKKVMKEIKGKLEAAKLNLIYAELESLNIPFERKYSTVKELKKDLKVTVSDLDYNKIDKIIENIDNQLNSMVGELEKGSTTAFTRVMTSDLSKTIAKSLGITLAGRTALILAPTIGTKALVGAGLAGYGLYRLIKNRKDIIKANENNELNNILMDLETTKEDGKYIDTRFSEEAQKAIRDYLKDNNIEFEDTGYRSLRQAMYNMDAAQKRGLCDLLNIKLGRNIEVEKRVASAKRKLNVISSTAATVGAGSALGVQIANTINSVDPGIAAGVLNGTVLGTWLASVTDKPWFGALTGGLGLIGTEVLEHVPIIGGVCEKIFAAENLAAFATLGAAGGLVVSTGLGLASAIKKIYSYAKNKKENEEFLKLDASKYAEVDKEELAIISQKLHEPANLVESVIVDIVLGYLKDENITIEGTPKSVDDLKNAISKLNNADKKKANAIMSSINYNLDNNPDFVKDLKKAGKMSIGLFTAGLAVMSVYDIIKGGTFLPELSQKIFPKNNIHTPVEVPPDLDAPLDPTNSADKKMINHSEPTYNEFKEKPEYMIENNGDATIDYGINYGLQNPGIAGYSAQQYIMETGMNENAMPWLVDFVDWLAGLFGAEPVADKIPNIPLICEKLDTLSPRRLYEFYRYFNSVPNDGSPMYEAVREALSYNSFLERASSYINGFEKTQQLHSLINDLTNKLATGAIPLATALEVLGIAQKKSTNQEFAIDESEVHHRSR